jgi:phospholipase C
MADIAGGKMNGFIRRRDLAPKCGPDPKVPGCASGNEKDVVAYHTGAEIPNYWRYAQDFVLQDHMFEPELSWSLPAHLWLVSEWSALCTSPDPMSCTNDDLDHPGFPPGWAHTTTPPFYAWADLTYLLHKAGVSWRYYVFAGTEPDCQQDRLITCTPVKQNATTPSIWNPLPYFETVQQDGQLGDIQSLSNFFKSAKNDNLPAVSWIMPTDRVSEHPPAAVSLGQSYVTGLINTIMQSREWKSTAIFLTWDDWGGLYDSVEPPPVDANGYGLRVPGLLISPYARHGVIDHHTLSLDAYNKFIEDDFLGSQRLDPATDGWPDPRPYVPENLVPGDLIKEFNFNQPPRPPVMLPVHPKTDLR